MACGPEANGTAHSYILYSDTIHLSLRPIIDHLFCLERRLEMTFVELLLVPKLSKRQRRKERRLDYYYNLTRSPKKL